MGVLRSAILLSILREFLQVGEFLLLLLPDKPGGEQARRMLIGSKGSVVGVIGKSARLELQSMFKRVVHLMLDIKSE